MPLKGTDYDCVVFARAQVLAFAGVFELRLPRCLVFGGETREHDALALLLRSGDVLVMVNRSFDDWHSLTLSRIVPRAGGQCVQVLPRCASRSA